MRVCFLNGTTWQRSSDFVGVAKRKRTNSLREMGEWSSGGCEFWYQGAQMTGQRTQMGHNDTS